MYLLIFLLVALLHCFFLLHISYLFFDMLKKFFLLIFLFYFLVFETPSYYFDNCIRIFFLLVMVSFIFFTLFIFVEEEFHYLFFLFTPFEIVRFKHDF